MGINFASLGALLPELRSQANVALEDSGALFGARGGGYMFGALVSAFLVDRLCGYASFYFAFWVTMAAVATALLPIALTLIEQCSCIFFIGVAMGALDCGANAVLCWECDAVDVKVDPFLQLMHSGFALGSFVAPIFMRYVADFESHKVAFWSLAGLYIFVPMAFVALGKTALRKDEKPDLTGATTLEKANSQRLRKRRVRFEWALVVVCSAVIAFYLGLESGGGGFLLTYAKDFVALSGVELLWINAALWGSFFVGRLIAIAVATRTRPFIVLALAPLLTITSMLIPIIFGHTQATTWVATILFGFSMAPIFPTIFAYVEVNMDLNAKHSAIIVVGGGIGDIALPLIMSEVFGVFGLVTFPMLLVAIAVLMGGMALFSVVFARKLHSGTRYGATKATHKASLRELERTPSERLRNGGSLASSTSSLDASTYTLNSSSSGPLVRAISIPNDPFKDTTS
jgi:FHS family glucose/mannose:H+ symporter-like MFS transporter